MWVSGREGRRRGWAHQVLRLWRHVVRDVAMGGGLTALVLITLDTMYYHGLAPDASTVAVRHHVSSQSWSSIRYHFRMQCTSVALARSAPQVLEASTCTDAAPSHHRVCRSSAGVW